MTLSAFGFLNMSFIDALDILLMALIIFIGIRWIRNSAALNIFLAVIFIYAAVVVVDALGMKLMSALLGTFVDVGVLALIIIFQPEIRHFLYNIGNQSHFGARTRKLFRKILGGKAEDPGSSGIGEIVEACQSMSENKTGALLVFPHNDNLDFITATGDKIDAAVSRRLIMNIFFKNSPLHDGAVVIMGGRIAAARCTLPITDRTDIPAKFGMRHKAAIGISEQSDADVVVVSEQSGKVSFVSKGKIVEVNRNDLHRMLEESLSPDRHDKEPNT